MPQIIPFVVTAITAVTSAVVAAGPLAVAAFNAANVIGAAALANEAFKAVQPQVKSSSTALEWNADPNAPNRFAFGRVGGAGNIIHNATYGPDKMFVGFVGVMSASGPIKSWQAFKADDAFVSFNAAGMAINTEYAGEMYLGRQRGLQPEATYLPSPSGLKHGAAMPRWGASYKLSGKAAYMYTLAENSKRSAFKGKVPTGIHYIEGLYCYDPRFDSSYPGGTGPCRIDDPTTWVYSTNAYIHALNWNIGRWEGEARGLTPKRYGVPYASMKVGGIGATPEGIDFSGYVEAANVFDENAWACSAWPDADQSKAAVLDSFLQAGGGIYAERQGKISCLHRAAPRASVVTITADDTAGTIEYDTTTSLLERINTIRPEYWSEAHGWQMVATDEVTSDVWREEDGQGVAVTRSKGLAYNYVPQSKQARELAALQIAHTREGIRGTAPLRHYLDLEVGDCFTFEVPEAILNGQKCIVLNVDPDLENDIINVTFASESDGKYPFAFGQADRPPPAPALQPADNTVSPPLPGDWTITPRPPAPGGGQLPGFDLGGIVSNETATAVIVEYGPTATGPWTQAYQGPPTVTNIPIDGVQPGATYYIAVQYQRNQNYSERYVYGPYTAPDLIAGGLSPDAADKVVREVLDQVGDIAAGTEAAEQVAELVLETIINENDALVKEAKERGEGIAIAYQGAVQHADNKIAEVTYTMATIAMLNDAQAATLNQSRSYTDGRVATAMNTVYTKAEVDAGRSTTLQEAKSYSDAKASEASLLYATKAERADGDAATYASMKSYVDAYKAEANLTFATTSQFNGVSATAAIALSTAQSAEAKLNEARLRMVTAASGGKPAVFEMYSGTEGGSYIVLGAEQIGFGTNSVFDDATDTIQTVINGRRRVIAWGAPFGAQGNLLEWWGPDGVALSAMTTVNGYDGRMTVAPYRFDNTSGVGFHVKSSHMYISASRTGPGSVGTANVTVDAVGAVGPVDFIVYRMSGDASIEAFPVRSTASTAPYRHILSFDTNLTNQTKQAVFGCSARDAAGNTGSVVIEVQLFYNDPN
ncbi:host specificity protein J [Bacteriophage sp. 438212]|nr:host specificity protein J [Bacteriophage sp. 438212]